MAPSRLRPADPGAATMFEWALISIVILPTLLGSQVAMQTRGRQGLIVLVAVFFVYCFAYIVMLYYLRHRWGIG